MTFGWTVAMLAAGLLLGAYCLWHQHRPRDLGEVSIFPATFLLGLALVFVVVALAHLVTLLTGHAPGRQLI